MSADRPKDSFSLNATERIRDIYGKASMDARASKNMGWRLPGEGPDRYLVPAIDRPARAGGCREADLSRWLMAYPVGGVCHSVEAELSRAIRFGRLARHPARRNAQACEDRPRRQQEAWADGHLGLRSRDKRSGGSRIGLLGPVRRSTTKRTLMPLPVCGRTPERVRMSV